MGVATHQLKKNQKKKPALWKRKFNSAQPPVDAFAGHRNLVRNLSYMFW